MCQWAWPNVDQEYPQSRAQLNRYARWQSPLAIGQLCKLPRGGPVAQHQRSQYDIKNIELRLVTEQPMTAEEETSLSTVIREALGHPIRLDFYYFEDQFPCSAGGKFEELASMLT